MPIKFSPKYTISSKTAGYLMRIEAVREKILNLPLNPTVLASLRETARLITTHYSTMIEGNRLEPEQIDKVIKHKGHFPGRERDESEVKGYYAAISQVEQWAAKSTTINEKMLQTLHALVMADGKFHVKPSSYRDGQNVIRDGHSKSIVYMPPEAKDVPGLMKGLLSWINTNSEILCPITAGITHYQFATIHPYYDGNGRTARLLTTLILHQGSYDLKGLYSLEEYYGCNLGGYYEALNIGSSHNYYMGRSEADITKWVEYFIEGMSISFENILKRMNEADNQGLHDHTSLIRNLDVRQRRVLNLFQAFATITSSQVGEIFGLKPRTSTKWCKEWVNDGFLEIVDISKKGRKYKLARKFEKLI